MAAITKKCRTGRRKCKDNRCYRKKANATKKGRCRKGTRRCRDNKCHKKK